MAIYISGLYNSKQSVRCFLLRIGNVFGEKPIGHSLHRKKMNAKKRFWSYSKFPGLTLEKLEAAIFDAPQIRTLTKYQVEKSAWGAFVSVVRNLLRNRESKNRKICKELIEFQWKASMC